MRKFLIGLIVLVMTPTASVAWNVRGHRAIAEIAQHYLSERASTQVHELLGEGVNSLVEAAMWADNIIDDQPETFFWHSVEIPHNGQRYDAERDCFNDDCVVERINRFAPILANRARSNLERSDALKFLIHFVADVHVPFHAYAPGTTDDIWAIWEGWEGPWLQIGDKISEQHNWWDSGFVVELGPNASDIAKKLVASISEKQRAAWTSSTPEEWANESFMIARNFVIKHDLINVERIRGNSKTMPIMLPPSTLDEAKSIVAQRLQMAGVRLAWLLNQAFK